MTDPKSLREALELYNQKKMMRQDMFDHVVTAIEKGESELKAIRGLLAAADQDADEFRALVKQVEEGLSERVRVAVFLALDMWRTMQAGEAKRGPGRPPKTEAAE